MIRERIEITRDAAGLWAGRRIGQALAPAAAVKSDDAIALQCKGCYLGFPARAGAGIGMQQHDRSAGAPGVDEPELYARKLRISAVGSRFGGVPGCRKTQTTNRQTDDRGKFRQAWENATHLSLRIRSVGWLDLF